MIKPPDGFTSINPELAYRDSSLNLVVRHIAFKVHTEGYFTLASVFADATAEEVLTMAKMVANYPDEATLAVESGKSLFSMPSVLNFFVLVGLLLKAEGQPLMNGEIARQAFDNMDKIVAVELRKRTKPDSIILLRPNYTLVSPLNQIALTPDGKPFQFKFD